MKHTIIAFALLVSGSMIPVSLAAAEDDELTLDQLPEPVRKTVEVEVKDGQITEIERELEDGETVYEVEFVVDGAEYELDIAADGTLLRRHRD